VIVDRPTSTSPCRRLSSSAARTPPTVDTDGHISRSWFRNQIWSKAVKKAIFEYLEIFHNRRRRRSALGMLTPIEYELHHPLRSASSP
jgi:transposase InsO family protein